MIARYWREILIGIVLLLAGAALMTTRLQLEACRTERAEFKRAYEAMARSVQIQNEAVQSLEKKSAETARRAATLRAQAEGATRVAKESADALAGFLGAPRPTSACPVSEAVALVRQDLGR